MRDRLGARKQHAAVGGREDALFEGWSATTRAARGQLLSQAAYDKRLEAFQGLLQGALKDSLKFKESLSAAGGRRRTSLGGSCHRGLTCKWKRLVLSCLVLSRLVLSCLVLSRLVSSCLASAEPSPP